VVERRRRGGEEERRRGGEEERKRGREEERRRGAQSCIDLNVIDLSLCLGQVTSVALPPINLPLSPLPPSGYYLISIKYYVSLTQVKQMATFFPNGRVAL